MASKACSFIVVLGVILLSAASITGFNITRLLEQHSDYSTFNSLLSETKIAQAINSRRTITVLVVENSGMSSVTQRSKNAISYILAAHVILDYYDELKLSDLSKNKSGSIVTTLLQTSGMANNRQGFLNVTVSDGEAIFGSAVRGAQHDSRVVKMVAAQAGNISVIQVSTPIIVPGLVDGSGGSPSDAPTSFEDSVTPTPKKKKAPSSSDDDDDSSDDDASAPSDDPADADSPSPSDDSKVADGGKDGGKKTNGATKAAVGGGALVTALIGLVGLLL